ncbi:putative n-carbamoylsarcosine amidase [Phaeomoniella chlamydospora]|uniref:Putative n-carbamoylsarcosine amidase n=1 Tax=Phaeomoniella chlamydospora TaxID=158046 RepID=A0A0G2EM78_PHACM|nr:putative n-carbamoylsarcosine amidase [Phaeomoniella chlamydospora]
MHTPQLTPQSAHVPQFPKQSAPQPQHSQPRQLSQENDSSSKSAVKHRRAPVACRRCRRLRSKCLHTNAKPPCGPCYEAGPQEAAECFFPARGEPDKDREFRRRRIKASERSQTGDARSSSVTLPKSTSVNGGTVASSPSAGLPEDRWDLLPPLDEVIEGCRVFFTSYFQLGFLPKAMFIERLQRDQRSINPLLLLGLLGITARFVPKLVKRYGGPVQATQIMIEHARKLVFEEMYAPSLERIQGFFLLGVAEWGNGDKIQSSIHMGIAVRMAGIMRLHQEEAYDVSKSATADEVVNSEVARRTFWVIVSQDSLHSGATTPACFSLNDITALLPCDEADFAFGNIPKERAALSGTQAAKYDDRLAYLAIVMVLRLSNIVVRRIYLEDIMNAKTNQSDDGAPPAFWDQMSMDLFTNVLELHEQVDAFFSLRSHDEGFPAMIVFSVYTCGSLAYYLSRWPQLCPPLMSRSSIILDRSMEVLKTLSGAWPLAMRWQQALTRVALRNTAIGTGDLHSEGPPAEQYGEMPVPKSEPERQQHRPMSRPSASANLELLINAAVQNDAQSQMPNQLAPNPGPQQGYLNVEYSSQPYLSPSAFAADDFETELYVFLQGGEASAFWNSAVVLGMCVAGSLPWIRGAFLVPAQILGGIIAAALVSCMLPGPISVNTTLGPGVSIAQGVFIEMFLTAQLIFVILMLAAEKHRATFIAPIGIGLALFVSMLAGVYYTGASLNPARSFGPSVASASFPGYHWIYWVGPALGALLAALYYRFVKWSNYEEVNPGQDATSETEKERSTSEAEAAQAREMA